MIIPIIGSLGFQLVFNRKVFFVGDGNNAWLRYPFWYGLFDYNLLYTNALIGITICISRLAMLFLFFIFFIARLDKTTMPGPRGGFLNNDPGTQPPPLTTCTTAPLTLPSPPLTGVKAYIGMLRLDHRYNNPIFLVFGDIMLERLRMTRVRAVLRKMRRTFLKTKFAREIEERKAEIRAEGGTSAAAQQHCSSSAASHSHPSPSLLLHT